jgi:hypothetical protein
MEMTKTLTCVLCGLTWQVGQEFTCTLNCMFSDLRMGDPETVPRRVEIDDVIIVGPEA